MDTHPNIEAELKSDDLETLIKALTYATMYAPKLDVHLLFNLLDHPVNEIRFLTFDTLGTMANTFYEQIAEEIYRSSDNTLKQDMLLATLAINPTVHNVQYFTDMLSSDNQELQGLAANILAYYSQAAIIPLLAKIDTATEAELHIIRDIFDTIEKKQVLMALKSFPFPPLLKNLIKVFDPTDLEGIQWNKTL